MQQLLLVDLRIPLDTQDINLLLSKPKLIFDVSYAA